MIIYNIVKLPKLIQLSLNYLGHVQSFIYLLQTIQTREKWFFQHVFALLLAIWYLPKCDKKVRSW